jgi:tRNA threonylcarbamoyladenosine biosynthesis protein TsaE
MELAYVSSGPDRTRALGRALGERLGPGDFVALVGDLGSGKTCLAQGILAGLGVADPGGSPTFIILQEYAGRLPVYHFDLYRLADPALELAGLGYEEYFYGDGVALVEWADRAAGLWPHQRLEVYLAHGSGPTERRITLRSTGARYAALVKEMADAGFGG